MNQTPLHSPVQMVALCRQNYGGRGILTNEEFTASSEAEADDLVAVRMAVRKKVAKAMLKTRELSAEAAPVEITPANGVVDAPAVATGKAGNYNRRDVRATR